MITSEQEMLAFLDQRQISYQYLSHPAVFTCEEAALHRPPVAAVSTKNLFLSDKKGRRFFLAVTACEKQVRLDSLSLQLDCPKLRFASESHLHNLLGVTRGSVTVLGLVNDSARQVELWIDTEIWDGEFFLCHPLVNTASLVLSKQSLERFFSLTGHTMRFFE
ncbi:MAG: prolyl-tRNA synthetase associated domain-containing protein [Anaerolineales bacterium]